MNVHVFWGRSSDEKANERGWDVSVAYFHGVIFLGLALNAFTKL